MGEVKKGNRPGIPGWPDSRMIRIEDRPVFDREFSIMQPRISEFTFTNLFLWGKAKGFQASVLDGHVLVFHDESGTRSFFPPIGPDPARVIGSVFRTVKGRVAFIRVPEDVARQVSDPGLSVRPDPDNFDYVYNRSDLAGLRGARYYPKRSFAARAMRYGPKIIDDKSIDIERCRRLQQEWCDLRGCDKNKGLSEEATAIYNLFKHKPGLDAQCVGVEIEGKLAAFAVVSELNRETCVVHFEKADTAYVGIYQLINNEYAKRVPEKYRYINREQDLGIEGIRKAKQSYYPAFMVKKYRIERKA